MPFGKGGEKNPIMVFLEKEPRYVLEAAEKPNCPSERGERRTRQWSFEKKNPDMFSKRLKSQNALRKGRRRKEESNNGLLRKRTRICSPCGHTAKVLSEKEEKKEESVSGLFRKEPGYVPEVAMKPNIP